MTLFRYPVYDADASAPAHFLLPKRIEPANATNATDVSANVTAASTRTPLPGGAMRWQLKEDMSGLQGMARMTVRAQQMYSTYVSGAIGVETDLAVVQ